CWAASRTARYPADLRRPRRSPPIRFAVSASTGSCFFLGTASTLIDLCCRCGIGRSLRPLSDVRAGLGRVRWLTAGPPRGARGTRARLRVRRSGWEQDEREEPGHLAPRGLAAALGGPRRRR